MYLDDSTILMFDVNAMVFVEVQCRAVRRFENLGLGEASINAVGTICPPVWDRVN